MNVSFRTSYLRSISNADKGYHMISDRQVDRICDGIKVGKEKIFVGLFHSPQSAQHSPK